MVSRKLAVAVLLMFLAAMLASSGAGATSTISVDGAVISTFDDSKDVAAGEPVDVTVTVMNTSKMPISVHLSSSPGSVTVTIPVNEWTINPNDAVNFKLTAKTDRYAQNGDYSASVKISVYNYETGKMDSAVLPITLHVKSSYTSDSEFNRILGIFPPLPAPLDTPAATAGITFLIWCAIAALVFGIVYLFVRRFFRNEIDDGKGVLKITGSVAVVVVLLIGITNTMSVYGADPIAMAAVESVMSIVFIVLGAIIVWNLYKSIVSALLHRSEKRGKLADVDNSLIPLFKMLGKLAICVTAAAMILSVLGFNLVALLTGAGIVAVAVSLGAQTTLERFFSGVMILVTRPFVVGDMVQIDGETIYEVKRIGMMNCEFKNWENQEYTVMPNTAVSKSKISNITKKTAAYRILLYFDTDYDADVELTKKIILEEANKNASVIKDGSYSLPEVRLESFEDSWMTFRLACYIDDFRKNVSVSGELREKIYVSLLAAGIECPFETVEVHIDRE